MGSDGIEPPSRRLQRHVSTSFTNFPPAEAKRIELLTVYFTRRRFQDAFLVRAGQPPCLARTEGVEPSLFGFVDRCVHPVTPRSQRRRAVDSFAKRLLRRNHNCSSICLANSADRLIDLLSIMLSIKPLVGRAGIEPAMRSRRFYRPLPTPIGEPTYVEFGSADGTCSLLPGGYPLITRLKDVPLDHFASAPCMPCKLKKLLIHTQELNL